jgi:NAD(P)-dependent dehydrogenase (short-subunit alcohol dehydrogenase family)
MRVVLVCGGAGLGEALARVLGGLGVSVALDSSATQIAPPAPDFEALLADAERLFRLDPLPRVERWPDPVRAYVANLPKRSSWPVQGAQRSGRRARELRTKRGR